MPKTRAWKLAAVVLWAVAQATPARAQGSALDLMRAASAVYTQQVHGVVSYRAIADQEISAPLYQRKVHSVSYIVSKDGKPVRSLLARLIINGKEASRQEMKDEEERNNQGFQSAFKPPYDPRYTEDYSFELEPGSPHTVRFKARKVDSNHGNGTVQFDGENRVVEVRYVPAAMPDHANSGTVTIQKGETSAGLYGTRLLHLNFQGSMGFIHGNLVMDQHCERYQRFPSVEDAIAARNNEIASRP